MIIAPFYNPFLREVLIDRCGAPERLCHTPSVKGGWPVIWVIAFRKDVIIQVLIGAHCSNPF
jgi:hypothetical protein